MSDFVSGRIRLLTILTQTYIDNVWMPEGIGIKNKGRPHGHPLLLTHST